MCKRQDGPPVNGLGLRDAEQLRSYAVQLLSQGLVLVLLSLKSLMG